MTLYAYRQFRIVFYEMLKGNSWTVLKGDNRCCCKKGYKCGINVLSPLSVWSQWSFSLDLADFKLLSSTFSAWTDVFPLMSGSATALVVYGNICFKSCSICIRTVAIYNHKEPLLLYIQRTFCTFKYVCVK